MYNDKRYSLLIQATNCTRRISIFFFTKTTFFTLHPNLSSHNPEAATLPVVYPSYPKDNGGKKWKAVSIHLSGNLRLCQDKNNNNNNLVLSLLANVVNTVAPPVPLQDALCHQSGKSCSSARPLLHPTVCCVNLLLSSSSACTVRHAPAM